MQAHSTQIVTQTAGPGGATAGGADPAGRGAGGRTLAAVFAPIAFLLLPFFFHRSGSDHWLGYSSDYAAFLVGLTILGLLLARLLLWTVRRTQSQRRVASAWMLLAVALTPVAAAELVLGYLERDVFADHHHWGHVRSPLMGFELGPDRRATRENDYGVPCRYTTGPDAFRTHLASRPPPDRETLIIVMGDSSAFGYGLNDDETWPHILEKHLRSRFGDDITVLNAANSGHTSLQQLIRLYYRVLPLRPDLILYYGMVNDVRADAEIDTLTLQAPLLIDPQMLGVTTTRQFLRRKNTGKSWYFRNSLVLNHLKRAYEGWMTDSNDAAVQRWARSAPATQYAAATAAYLRNLDTMRLLCEANDAAFIPITFIAYEDGAFATGLDRFNAALRTHCAARDTTLIDLHPAFDSQPDKRTLFYKDHYHPTAAGARWMALQVADELMPMLAGHRFAP